MPAKGWIPSAQEQHSETRVCREGNAGEAEEDEASLSGKHEQEGSKCVCVCGADFVWTF